MPKVTITHNAGDAPVIPASAQRTTLFIQNNTLKNVRVRFFGGVSLNDETKTGLLLAAASAEGQPGGSTVLTGAAAQRPLYALHEGESGDVVKLDIESDA